MVRLPDLEVQSRARPCFSHCNAETCTNRNLASGQFLGPSLLLFMGSPPNSRTRPGSTVTPSWRLGHASQPRPRPSRLSIVPRCCICARCVAMRVETLFLGSPPRGGDSRSPMVDSVCSRTYCSAIVVCQSLGVWLCLFMILLPRGP